MTIIQFLGMPWPLIMMPFIFANLGNEKADRYIVMTYGFICIQGFFALLNYATGQ